MLSITTKYLPGTESKGSRIKASTKDGHTVTIGYPHEFSGVDCHTEAVKAFLNKYPDFPKQWAYGDISDSGYVFVALLGYNTITGE